MINIVYPRFGLSTGKLMVVVAIDDRIQLEDGGAGIEVEVTAFG